MIEQLKNLLAEIPSGVYSLLATLIPLFGAVLLHNQKVKALQEIAEKNIEMFKEVPSTSKAHAIFEEIVTRDAEKIRREGAKKKDPSSIVIAVVFLIVAYFLGVFDVYLGSLGGWSILGSVATWCVVAAFGLLGLVGLLQGLGWMEKKEDSQKS